MNLPNVSSEADRIEREKPVGWEFFLFAKVLDAGLLDLRDRYKSLRTDRQLWSKHPLSASEVQTFIQSQAFELVGLLKTLDDLLNTEYAKAIMEARASTSGSPIRHVAEEVARCCQSLYEWELAIGQMAPPSASYSLQVLRLLQGGITENWFSQIAALPDKMRDFVVRSVSEGRSGSLTLDIDFSLPPALREYTDTIETPTNQGNLPAARLVERRRERANDDLLYIGQAVQHYSARGDRVLKYSVEMRHDGLQEHKILSAPDYDVLVTKVKFQSQKWTDKWIESERKRADREQRAASAEEAERRTREAFEAVQQLHKILEQALSVNPAIDWEALKVHDAFGEVRPTKPLSPMREEIPPAPNSEDRKYHPNFTVFDRIFTALKKRKEQQSAQRFIDDSDLWEDKKAEIEQINSSRQREHENSLQSWDRAVKEWESRKNRFEEEQSRINSNIDELRAKHGEHDPAAVEQYCEMVLDNSAYPDIFLKDFELQYNPETKILVVEYRLVNPEDIPNTKEVKYIKTRNEMKEVLMPEAESQRLYDDVIYQVVLRTIHDLLEADKVNAIDAVSFNGWVHYVSKATGKDEDACIVSIQATKTEFAEIDLARVDPRTCFKNLRGVGSSKLYGITPIQPMLQINKSDRRFVEGRDVADKLSEGTNIAAMDWEEFEHLIREVFEKEFSVNGGEVKITQASRDGGVDAVAW